MPAMMYFRVNLLNVSYKQVNTVVKMSRKTDHEKGEKEIENEKNSDRRKNEDD